MIFPIQEHPLRRTLAGEVHARPFEVMAVPVRVSHLAVLHGDSIDAAAERAHLAALLAQHGAELPGEGSTHFSRDLGGLRLRFERHNEFSTYTFLRFDAAPHPFAETALALVAPDWLARIPGKAIAAVHLAVEREDREAEALSALFSGNLVVGARVTGGAAEVWTDFHLHADGFGRVLVRDLSLSGPQIGRLVQRLLEIETYRLLALLAFPVARQAAAEVMRIDRDIATIISTLADPAIRQNDRILLERLTGLAAEAERLDAATAFRLSAARAYYAIVNQRVAELREERIAGVQTVAEFMCRRLAPAMKTCDSAAERQSVLSARISRTGDLLRTRVDIALEEKNGDLLHSMNRRAKLQLRLQEAVEGLSVVAISYYLLGLVGYAAKGLKAAGLPIDTDVAAMVSLPVIVAALILMVLRLRRAMAEGDED